MRPGTSPAEHYVNDSLNDRKTPPRLGFDGARVYKSRCFEARVDVEQASTVKRLRQDQG